MCFLLMQAWDDLLMELVNDDKITIDENEIETTDGNSLVGLKVAEASTRKIERSKTAKDDGLSNT